MPNEYKISWGLEADFHSNWIGIALRVNAHFIAPISSDCNQPNEMCHHFLYAVWLKQGEHPCLELASFLSRWLTWFANNLGGIPRNEEEMWASEHKSCCFRWPTSCSPMFVFILLQRKSSPPTSSPNTFEYTTAEDLRKISTLHDNRQSFADDQGLCFFWC